MKIKFILVLVYLFIFQQCPSGCNWIDVPYANQGFNVALRIRFVTPFGTRDIGGDGFADGRLLYAGAGALGNITEFFNVTVFGNTRIAGAKVPGGWSVFGFFTSPSCLAATASASEYVLPGGTINVFCNARLPTVTFTPGVIDVRQPPAYISGFAEGINQLQGTPIVIIYNERGQRMSTATISSMRVTGKGTSFSIPTPNVTFYRDGYYLVLINNVKPDGKLEPVSAGYFNTIGGLAPDFPIFTDPCVSQLPQCLY